MVKVLALDYGTVRIGIAIANTAIGIAHVRDFLGNNNEFWNNLDKLCTTEKIEQILVGQPRTLAGNSSAQTKQVATFVNKLKTKLTLPVGQIDERLSTISAANNLTEAGIKTKDQKNLIDSEAARIFLQAWLDKTV